MKENQLIDKIAKDALEHYEMPFEPAHWDIMERRLSAQRKPHSASVFAVKALELLLMTVTLGSVLYYANASSEATETAQIHPATVATPAAENTENAMLAAQIALVNNETQPVAMRVSQPLAFAEIRTQTAANTSEKTTFAQAKNTENVTVNSIANTTTIVQNTTNSLSQNLQTAQQTAQQTATKTSTKVIISETLPDDEHIVIDAAPSVVHDGNLKTAPQNSVSNTVSNNISNNKTNDNTNTILAKPLPNTNKTTRNETDNTKDERSKTSLPSLEKNILIDKIPSLQAQPLMMPTMEFNLSTIKSAPIADIDAPYETATMLRRRPVLKGLAGYELSTIAQADGAQKAQTKNNRFGLGIVFSVFKKLNLETGVELSQKSYSNENRYSTATFDNTQSIQNTALMLAEIPFLANMNIFETKKLHIYAKGGVRFATLLNAQYTWGNGSDAAYSNFDAAATNSSRINGQQYEEITSATNFWSVGGGIGVSYHLSPRVNVFAEPSVYHALNGIGQRRDFIHTAGLGIGVSCVL
jgi:Outer membrane protein beta-barrel domain